MAKKTKDLGEFAKGVYVNDAFSARREPHAA